MWEGIVFKHDVNNLGLKYHDILGKSRYLDMRLILVLVTTLLALGCSTIDKPRPKVVSHYQPKPADPTQEEIETNKETELRIMRNREINKTKMKNGVNNGRD